MKKLNGINEAFLMHFSGFFFFSICCLTRPLEILSDMSEGDTKIKRQRGDVMLNCTLAEERKELCRLNEHSG